jgi:hypothetical protein
MRQGFVREFCMYLMLFGLPNAVWAQQAPTQLVPSIPCNGAQPCLQPNNGQSTSAPDMKQQPIDLTLQYPGKDSTLVPPQTLDVVGNAADASAQVVNKSAGSIAGTVVEGVGATASAITTTYDVVNGAVTGSQNGGGIPGASVGALKAGVADCAAIGVAAAVTALCAPVLGPIAPAVGVAAGLETKDATESYLNSYQQPAPTDNSFNCAKNGDCATPSDFESQTASLSAAASNTYAGKLDDLTSQQTELTSAPLTTPKSNTNSGALGSMAPNSSLHIPPTAGSPGKQRSVSSGPICQGLSGPALLSCECSRPGVIASPVCAATLNSLQKTAR